jgi:hypothetical protein
VRGTCLTAVRQGINRRTYMGHDLRRHSTPPLHIKPAPLPSQLGEGREDGSGLFSKFHQPLLRTFDRPLAQIALGHCLLAPRRSQHTLIQLVGLAVSVDKLPAQNWSHFSGGVCISPPGVAKRGGGEGDFPAKAMVAALTEYESEGDGGEAASREAVKRLTHDTAPAERLNSPFPQDNQLRYWFHQGFNRKARAV